MAAINPYLTFNGNAEEAFNFYKSVFGGDFAGGINRFKDTPGSEKMSAEDQQKVMHVSLPIGKGTMLMASDYVAGMGAPFAEGNNFSITISTDTAEEARRLFDGLSAGGTVGMPLGKTFWADLFGMFTDKYKINWMVNYGDGQGSSN